MESNLMSVWGTIGSVALAILILLVMITIHEFGHYLAGRLLKFKIDEFSVGFGPALCKIRRKKTGELFAVRLIPLGGYCAFHGEDGLDEEEEAPPTLPSPLSEGGGENGNPSLSEGGGENGNPSLEEPRHSERSEESRGTESECSARSFDKLRMTPSASAEPSVPSASGVGSPACPPPASGESAPACPPPASGGGVGEGVRPQPPSAPKKRDWNDDGDFTHMKPWKRIIVLIAGATMNYLLAVVLIIICFFAYGQTMVAAYEVEETTGEYAAYSLQDLDIFLQAEGKNLYLTTDLAQALNGKKRGDIVTLRVSRAIGLQWAEDGEGGKQPEFDHREEMDVEVMLREDVSVKNSAEIDSVWKALGIKYEAGDGGGYLLANAVYRFSFWETLGRSFVYSFKIAGSIFRVLGELLTGKLGLSAFGGPVTTVTMTSQIVSRGFRYFLEIAGYIGVNLAVFNLLPIPALDGSKVVFTAIEWARGKPISRKIEAVIHAVGFVLLLGFAVLVDILQFI